MGLTLILGVPIYLFFDICLGIPPDFPTSSSNNTSLFVNCPDYGQIEHATLKIIDTVDTIGFKILHVQCKDGYELIGPPKILCSNGEWEESVVKPQCVDSFCPAPPYITNGALEIDGHKDDRELYGQGTKAIYTCGSGYDITPISKGDKIVRRCEKGIWTGPFASCILQETATGCSKPNDVANGHFVPGNFGDSDEYSVGQRVHYSCSIGYILNGTPMQQCLEDGTWSPRIQPTCSAATSNEGSESCPPAATVPHAFTVVTRGEQTEESAAPDTEVEIRCVSKYRNTHAPCQPARLRCFDGRWVGVQPNCVPVKECSPPPVIPHGAAFELSPSMDSGRGHYYPPGSEISFRCLPGYELQGDFILRCSTGGCWEPSILPTCRRDEQYYVELSGGTFLASIGTGVGVLLLLVVICLTVVCRRRKPWTRAASLPPPVPRVDLADHAALLHHPDRLALIAFADGLQNGQSVLPSYEEAVRDRGPGAYQCRASRPHWPALALRRSRVPNSDSVHVTRQGSFASHSASTRSGGDPMGSTDTMAVSENSTTITLDTVSSLSGSHPASCRAHCGSLASFDTSSILNTEGAPLLEENEQEDSAGLDSVSLALENRSMGDNSSYKLNTRTSPDLV